MLVWLVGYLLVGLRVCDCCLIVCICYCGCGCYCIYGLCLCLVAGFDLGDLGSGSACCGICLIALWEWCFG